MKDNSIKSQTIEWLRFFCAVAVVFIHIFAFSWGTDRARIFFAQGVCRVAVPVFFLISGYLFYVGLECWDWKIWKEKMLRRLWTLLIPYLVWNILSLFIGAGGEFVKYFLDGGAFPDLVLWFRHQGGIRALWDGRSGMPYDYPLWFIRDLIILVALSPVLHFIVRKTHIYGLLVLLVLYLSDFWIHIPGFSSAGFFFFSFGALFSIRQLDFTVPFRKYWIPAFVLALPCLIGMTMTFVERLKFWEYLQRPFTLFGSIAVIGMVASLFGRGRLRVHPLLSESSFFIFAAHGTIVLPFVNYCMLRLLPHDGQVMRFVVFLLTGTVIILVLLGIYVLMRRWMPKTLSFLTGNRAVGNVAALK